MKLKTYKMIFFFLFTALLLSFPYSQTVFSEETKSFQVVTREGKTLVCKNVKYGSRKVISEGKKALGGRDSHGNFFEIASDSKYEFSETTKIKLSSGTNFGITYELPEIEYADQVSLKVIAIFPTPIELNEKKETSISCQYEYDDRSKKEQYITWTFKKDEPHYHVKGDWKLEVYNKENLLISKKFTVE